LATSSFSGFWLKVRFFFGQAFQLGLNVSDNHPFQSTGLAPDDPGALLWAMHIALVGLVGYSYEVTQTESLRIIQHTLKQVDILNRQLLFQNVQSSTAVGNHQQFTVEPLDGDEDDQNSTQHLRTRAHSNTTNHRIESKTQSASLSSSSSSMSGSSSTTTSVGQGRRQSPQSPRERLVFDPLAKAS
jgi:hypothetical protein